MGPRSGGRDTQSRAGLSADLETDWLLLDSELMPWSLKAAGLLRRQYAAVGAASGAVFPGALGAVEAAAARGVEVTELLGRQAGAGVGCRRVHGGIPALLLARRRGPAQL